MRNPWSYLPISAGILVLVLSLALGVLTVTSKRPSQSLTTKAAVANASLALSPATGDYTFAVGTSYPVGIVLDSAGKTIDGVDIVINFDPTKARVEGTSLSTTSIFEQYPQNEVDNARGIIKLSGLTFTPKPLTGIITTFRFQPLVKGEVNFTFSFTPGATTDTNIADHDTAKDILGSVENGRYFFR